MNTVLKISSKAAEPMELFKRRRLAVAVAAALAVVAIGIGVWLNGSGDNPSAIATFEVRQGPLIISVTESGTIQNRDQVVVKNEVEGRTTILTLIPEGVQVKQGDLLVELDSSQLEDQRTRQQINVLNTEASFIRARENQAVIESQSESDIADTELRYKFAQLDLAKYIEGEYPQQLQQAQAEITIAEEELERARERLRYSKELAEAGYISRTELQADRLAANRVQIDLELAQSKLALLTEYTHQRRLDQLQSDVAQSAKALERVKRRITADMVQAAADLKARESEYNRQKSMLAKINEQIEKCTIYAPVSGMVVYATTGKGNWRGNREPLEEGQEVREREELICLPTTDSMMIEVKVHESSLTKIAKGMPVRVTIDALPGRTCFGRVGKIGLLPDAQSRWMNPDLKVYSTEIYLHGDTTGLRPGMSCRAEIIVERYEDAVYVPVQSVLRVNGDHTVYLAGRDGPVPRKVEVGLDNNRMIRIVNGLEEGEEILLAPPLEPSTRTDQEQIVMLPSEVTTRPAAEEAAPSETPTTQPAPEAAPGVDFSKLENMTREQRREFFESLTPEQRQELMKRRGLQKVQQQ